MKYVAILALLVAIPSAHAQIIKNVPPPAENAEYLYDCSKLSYGSPGCKSFNEMIENKDATILSNLKSPNHAFVCFVPYEDQFITLSFQVPPDGTFLASKTSPGLLVTLGTTLFYRFENGVQHSSDILFGEWRKTKSFSGPPVFVSEDSTSRTSAYISYEELSYSQQFENLAGTKTIYTLQIRRSTLRFTETFDFPEIPSATKGGNTTTKAIERSTHSGYCAEFK